MILDKINRAKLISELGNSLRYIAIPIAIFATTNGKAQHIAILEIYETFGFILAGILCPFFIDKTNKIKGLILSDILSVISSAFLFTAIYKQSLQLIYVSAFFMTLIDFYHSSLLNAVVAHVIKDKENLIFGYSKVQLFTLMGGLIGSFGGSFVMKHVMIHSLIVIDAITFVLSSLVVLKAISTVRQSFNTFSIQNNTETFNQFIRRCLNDWKAGYLEVWKSQESFLTLVTQLIYGMAHGIMACATIAHYKNVFRLPNHQVILIQASCRIYFFLGAFLNYAKKLNVKESLFIGYLTMVFGYITKCFPSMWIYILFGGFQQFGTSTLSPGRTAMVMRNSKEEFHGRISSINLLTLRIGILIGNIVGFFILKKYSTFACFYFSAGISLLIIPIYLKMKIFLPLPTKIRIARV